MYLKKRGFRIEVDDVAGSTNKPSRYCSSRHRMPLPLKSIIKGSQCVSMTWQALSGAFRVPTTALAHARHHLPRRRRLVVAAQVE